MKFKELKIAGLVIIEPDVFGDERGFFFESYNKKKFFQNDIKVDFVQDNHSQSSKGVLRGLHFQRPPFAQAKLVRVTHGEVLDVAVDLRKGSKTFGDYQAVNLSADNKKMFFIPRGFAHGFLTLSETADFCYKVDNFYNKEADSGIIWNDPDIAVNWPEMENILLSAKDKQWPRLKEIKDKLQW